MSVIANILKLETFGSFIRRYLIFLYPDVDWIVSQLPSEYVIDRARARHLFPQLVKPEKSYTHFSSSSSNVDLQELW